MKILTKGELAKISARIDEINEIIELCDSDRDSDVLDNLDAELDHWIKVLECSHRRALFHERGLRIVG